MDGVVRGGEYIYSMWRSVRCGCRVSLVQTWVSGTAVSVYVPVGFRSEWCEPRWELYTIQSSVYV